MAKSRIRLATVVALMSVSAWVQAQDLVLPTIPEATDAIVRWLVAQGRGGGREREPARSA